MEPHRCLAGGDWCPLWRGAMWLMNRADRMQEGYALRQAKDENLGREDRLHAQMMRLKMTADSLQLLAQSVAGEHYATTPADLDLMKNLHQEGAVKEMGEIALPLFYQLQRAGAALTPRRMFATSWQRSGRSLVCPPTLSPRQTLRRVGKNRW